MEHDEVKTQARALINELISYPFSQTFDILPIEQKLKSLYQQAPDAIEPLIGLMFVNIMLGNRPTALGLSDKIWSIGGNLSPFFELLYSDCLLNLAEVEKAGILLADRLDNIGENLQHFYMVMVKYALLSGQLALLQKIGGYPEIYQTEPELFRFADNHALNLSVKDYRAVLKIIMDNIGSKLCAWEYNMYAGDGIELIFYTTDDLQQNEALKEPLFEKLDGYFLSMQQPPIEDLFLEFTNITWHPAWKRSAG